VAEDDAGLQLWGNSFVREVSFPAGSFTKHPRRLWTFCLETPAGEIVGPNLASGDDLEVLVEGSPDGCWQCEKDGWIPTTTECWTPVSLEMRRSEPIVKIRGQVLPGTDVDGLPPTLWLVMKGAGSDVQVRAELPSVDCQDGRFRIAPHLRFRWPRGEVPTVREVLLTAICADCGLSLFSDVLTWDSRDGCFEHVIEDTRQRGERTRCRHCHEGWPIDKGYEHNVRVSVEDVE